jgi:hypothetical protein
MDNFRCMGENYMNERISKELSSFEGLWKGGYYEGDPLKPLSKSGYGLLNYMSVLHVIYLRCIKPYVNSETIALEIGPGRGAWTKALLPSKEIWALDAVSARDNKFFEYVGNSQNVKYFQVKNLDCQMLPEDYFNYMFSFGCLCHVSFQGITEYAKNLFSKLKKGTNCFWMIADYRKYNNAVLRKNDLSILNALAPTSRRYFPLKYVFKLLERAYPQPRLIKNDDNDEPFPGRWYDAGIERTCAMLKGFGYEIIDRDVGTSHRDPIIQFTKP